MLAFCAFTWPRMMFQGNIGAFIFRVAEFGFGRCWSNWKREGVDLIAGWKIWSTKSLKSSYVISTVSNFITSASTKIKFSHPEEEAALYSETLEGMCHPTHRSQQDWLTYEAPRCVIVSNLPLLPLSFRYSFLHPVLRQLKSLCFFPWGKQLVLCSTCDNNASPIIIDLYLSFVTLKAKKKTGEMFSTCKQGYFHYSLLYVCSCNLF